MPKILQVNFKYTAPTADFKQAIAPLADDFAAVPGLRWKVWLIDEAQSEAGGIYLFDDAAALQAMLTSPLWAGVGTSPILSDIKVKDFDVLEAPSLVTRAPIKDAVPA
jgi:hypothetical protein